MAKALKNSQQRKNTERQELLEVLKGEMEKRFQEQERLILERVKSSPSRKMLSNRSYEDQYIDQLSLELQASIGTLKSKLDAFSAKVDSIDLSYDKRISNLEATFNPLLASFESLNHHTRLITPSKISEQLSQELKSLLPI